MDAIWLQERITKCKLRIEALEDAIFALSSGKNQSYTLNTGQTVQTVTKKNIGDLEETLEGLINQCVTMQARLNGGSVVVTPGW